MMDDFVCQEQIEEKRSWFDWFENLPEDGEEGMVPLTYPEEEEQIIWNS